MNLAQLIRRKERAQATLEDPGLIEALEGIRAKAHKTFATSAAHDIEAREDAHDMLQAIDALEAELKSYVAASRLAESREDRHSR